jgi:enoyl-CoA hydratase/carnithine racemase
LSFIAVQLRAWNAWQAEPMAHSTDIVRDRVRVEITDGVADVRMIRADKMNALDGDMFLALDEVGTRLCSEPGLRAVVLSGEGRSFCAGLDFSSFQAMSSGAQSSGAQSSGAQSSGAGAGNPGLMAEGRITHLGQQVCWVWQEVPVPVIAAVHGHALGGGCQIALGADIRIAHPEAKFSVMEVKWGLVPDMTGTVMLTRLVRPDVAKELTFTGRVVSGTEAVAIGLATRLSDTPLDDALALAREIAVKSPDSVRGAKMLLNQALLADPVEQLAAERKVIGSLIGTPNQVEAVMSEFEKRPANFTDPH